MLAQLWKTSGGKTGMIFTVGAHDERERHFPSSLKIFVRYLAFTVLAFYNAMVPFPVAEKVWKRHWRFGLIGTNPNVAF